jgi:hypothetical protein
LPEPPLCNTCGNSTANLAFSPPILFKNGDGGRSIRRVKGERIYRKAEKMTRPDDAKLETDAYWTRAGRRFQPREPRFKQLAFRLRGG